ncbi:bifunctional DNA-formamidopyrimidine glycosylase/DNA-(apurinic or apyrimidinic site) lyase [Parvibium lacunae]|uniref:Formamidopyrimidine-DNA glycosylase n=1 Tax=Parvibium lacunae TaxID=1888893 RepID=A0A368KZG9_9BURK|nr:bifunctional DNA-formamidopyrimidine glycosylase/DNA-(apurinic or apyrimidinic site) lyase [Parvibium lacunae]RCS56524.1 bifunctional DNA-formamidopyrimidine glycosylase/DNA-(apurinic or apyrimidinic site) lyase [Parvibium lacunae]
MPELPEVEVTRMGVAPHIEGQTLTGFVARRPDLRWPIPDLKHLCGQRLLHTDRRGKYLLLAFPTGWVILHLGMSGHLLIVAPDTPARIHDHVDFVFGQQVLRLYDPRRFGAVLWHPKAAGPVITHAALARLGREPFDPDLTAAYLHRETRTRQAPIKQVLLAGDIVVGVGNIYASESLFRARIRPQTPAHRISLVRYATLLTEIQAVLREAIAKGGSTLKDFVGADGSQGYFQLTYFVYERAGQPCRVCRTPIKRLVQGQRATYYCPQCQR